MDEFHCKAACFDLLSCFMCKQVHSILELMLFQFQLNNTSGQTRGVDGAVELLHSIGNASNMIFMAMRQEHTAYLVLILDKICHICNNQINTVHFIIREAKAAVNDDDVLAVFQHGHIFSDLVQTAKRDNFQFFCQMISLFS